MFNRRSFLSFLGLAPVVGAATLLPAGAQQTPIYAALVRNIEFVGGREIVTEIIKLSPKPPLICRLSEFRTDPDCWSRFG